VVGMAVLDWDDWYIILSSELEEYTKLPNEPTNEPTTADICRDVHCEVA